MKHQIGNHDVELDGDTVFLQFCGDCSPQDIGGILRIIDSIGGSKDKIYILADLSALDKVSPETRRIASQWPGVGRIAGTAIIGATLITRAMVTLVARASTFLSHTPKTGEPYFCKSKEDAQRLIDSLRAARAGSAPPSA